MFKRLTLAFCLIALTALSVYKYMNHSSPMSREEMKAKLEATQLKFFLDQAHPVTGQVRDAAQNFEDTPASNRMSSIAATGFGLAVITNAATRGMVEMKFAKDYAHKTILFARDHIERRRGWFLHFVDWETGAKFGQAEFSTIDTELFMVGAMYAAQVLKDAEISKVVHELYADMDFQDFLTDGGTKPNKKTLSMAWAPEGGYSEQQWDMYAEERALLLMALGSPSHPLSIQAWQDFSRKTDVAKYDGGIKMMGVDYSLFTHQYSDLFVDFRNFHDGYDNYFDNGIKATRLHRAMAHEDQDNATVRAGFWGYSAGAYPSASGYEGWRPYHHDGTVCIGCALGSAMFMPDEVLGDAAKWAAGKYGDQIWGRYGFVDSLDLDKNWIADHVYGITTGPIFLSLANMREETSVWKDFMKIPEIELAMARASTPVLAGKAAGQERKPASEKQPSRK